MIGRHSDMTIDMFDAIDSAPVPARSVDTSQAAADRLAPTIAERRRKVLEEIRKAGQSGLTADQVADRLGWSVLSSRPRVSELKRIGLIEDTGERRRNLSGNTAAVFRVAR